MNHRFAQMLCPIAFLAACATGTEHEEIVAAYRSGNPTEALRIAQAKVDEHADRAKLDGSVFRLDVAMALLAQGKLTEAIAALQTGLDQVELVWRENRSGIGETAIAEYVASMVTNEGVIAYEALDHERLVANALLALLYEVAERPDTHLFAAANRCQRVRKVRAEDASMTGLVDVVMALLLEDGRRANQNEARKYWADARSREPSAVAEQAVARAQGASYHSAPNTAPVWAFVFEGPGFVRRTDYRRADKVMQKMLNSVPQGVLGSIFPAAQKAQVLTINAEGREFAVPRLEVVDTGVHAAQLCIDNTPHGLTLAADVEQRVEEDFAANQEFRDALAATRQLISPVGIVENFIAPITGRPLADTRCWSLMPVRVHAVRLEVPIGTHDVTLSVSGINGNSARTARVLVASGSTTYLLAVAPTAKGLGEIITNRPASGATP